jgi:molybdopterin-guanine dinucleotide biosynthesis adapter protein
MIPIVSFVGKSDSGKTTFLVKLLPELVRRGIRVATVKHDVHGFDVDREGKDSWRHKQAGAHTVVISSPDKAAAIRDVDRDMNLDEVREKLIRDVDIILSEGFKKDVQPKIEVYRKEAHAEPLCTLDDHLIAMVSDEPVDRGVPRFGLDDVRGVADFLEERFLSGKPEALISLRVNGKEIPLNPFVRVFLGRAVRGMVTSLKGCASPGAIDIHVGLGEID